MSPPIPPLAPSQERAAATDQFVLVMLHEQDPTKGFCPFRMFFEQTPTVLQKKYRLYDTVAVPLYPSVEHREVSLKFALRSMGASAARTAASYSTTLGSPSIRSCHRCSYESASSDSCRSCSVRYLREILRF